MGKYLHFDGVVGGFTIQEDAVVLDHQQLIKFGEEITVHHLSIFIISIE